MSFTVLQFVVAFAWLAAVALLAAIYVRDRARPKAKCPTALVRGVADMSN